MVVNHYTDYLKLLFQLCFFKKIARQGNLFQNHVIYYQNHHENAAGPECSPKTNENHTL